MIADIEIEKENADTVVNVIPRLPKVFISIGLTFLMICLVLLLASNFMSLNTSNYFLFTLISGILFGIALFFEGNGFYQYVQYDKSQIYGYFANPLLYLIFRVAFKTPYVILCYNGLIISGGVNTEFIMLLIVFSLPSIIAQASWRWTPLQKWLKSLDTA